MVPEELAVKTVPANVLAEMVTMATEASSSTTVIMTTATTAIKAETATSH